MSDFDIKLNHHDGRLVATFQDLAREEKPWFGQFVDRRAGVVWPTLNRPGYFCIFALEEMTDRPAEGRLTKYQGRIISYPHTFLVERKESDSKRFYELLLNDCARFHCPQIIAPQDRHGLAHAIDCSNYFLRRGREIPIHNCHDFSSLAEGKPLIDQALRDDKLEVLDLYGNATALSNELDGIPEGANEEDYPAIMALCHILTSYRISPFDPREDDDIEYFGREELIY